MSKKKVVNRCDTCLYFHRQSEESSSGQCRHSPPQIMVVKEEVDLKWWPWLDEGDWCGRHIKIL